MKAVALLGLRISLGWLMVLWGLDKITNVEHAVRVSEGFYAGLVTGTTVLQAAGVAQLLLGLLIVVGLARVVTYPILLAVTGITFVAVWRSIVDPMGFFLEGGNILFYPSFTIFFAGLLLYASREEDELSLDFRRRAAATD